MQALKETLSEDEADLVDEINKRDIIIANLQNQLREDTARLSQQVFSRASHTGAKPYVFLI